MACVHQLVKVLTPDIARYQNRKIWIRSCEIGLKFDRRLGSTVAEGLTKHQGLDSI